MVFQNRKQEQNRADVPPLGTVGDSPRQLPSRIPPPDVRVLEGLVPPTASPASRALRELLPAAHHDLAAAEAGGYAVRVLVKVIDGREKIAVLFGESHFLTTDTELELAKSVLRHFSTFLIEGVEADTYVGGRIHFDQIASLAKAECEDRGLNNQGAIKLTATSFNEAHKLAVVIQRAICDDLARGERSIKVAQEARNSSPEIYEEALRIVAKAFADAGCQFRCAEVPATNQVYHLEEGHRPTLAGHLHTLNDAFGVRFRDFQLSKTVSNALLCATGAWVALTVASPFLSWAPLNLAKSVCGWSVATYMGIFAAQAALYLTPLRRISETIENLVERGFHDAREETMARNAHTLALSENVQGPILIQMGRYHVEPVAKRLIHSFGWVAESGTGEEPS